MNLVQPFKMAIKSILSNKTRSALTMLGTIIGVASVIALMAIGQGSTASITEKIASQGSNLLTVSITGRGGATLDSGEMMDFIDQNEDLFLYAAPVTNSSNLTIKNGNKNTTTTSLMGTNEQYADIKSVELQEGRYISQSDCDNRTRIAIIGTYVSNELFGGISPVGSQLKINGTPFTVVGVLEETDDSTASGGDDKIVIPYTVASRLLKNATISQYITQAKDENSVEAAKAALTTFLSKKFATTSSASTPYRITDQSALMETLSETTGILTAMLGGIAGISLLVAGIGIMNIMLVSVTERTREIGIRKSIGAKRSDILTQFLIESIVISGMGGIIGIGLGVGFGNWLGSLIGITAVANAGIILLSFSFSLAMGVFFGYYPANKASKLNPIEALRSE